MYPNLFKQMDVERRGNVAQKSETSMITSVSSGPSTTSSEGSLLLQSSSQESKSSLTMKAPPRSPSTGFAVPSSPKLSEQPSPIKSPGIYVRRLPDRLQRLQDEKCAELSVQMFFEFMRTAYQVNDGFEELATTISANSQIDWSKLLRTDLSSKMLPEDESVDLREDKSVGTEEPGAKSVEPGSTSQEEAAEEGQDSSTLTTKARRASLRRQHFQKPGNAALGDEDAEAEKKTLDSKEESSQEEQSNPVARNKGKLSTAETFVEHKEQVLARIMKRKLSDILHEGLLDSVLPYMLPKPVFSQPIIKKSITNMDVKKVASSSGASGDCRTTMMPCVAKEKEREKNKYRRKSLENEVEIHVCDEAKNIKKDFRCPQKLLIQKMCYFADVTAGQKLEEMDISVHCDIVIFDWLMRWVKKDIIKKTEWPILESSNVIPIMVSASFLQMEPLLEDCLAFCHDNMSEVLRTSAILSCLNDNLLTRLAGLFTNVEVELLKDKKDKVQSRLFCKLIVSLVDPEPDTRRGHYGSLATLFKCGKCGKNVVRSISDSVPCVPSATRLDSNGELHSLHTREPTWTLNDYIVSLRAELRSWRKVYWRLWGDCHFLFCRQCGTHFPVHQMDWCCHHPEVPQFFANELQRSSPFPLGRYPCCSQRAYRFETLPNREGCRFKEHLPAVPSDRDVGILNIFAAHRDIVALEPPQLFFPEKITRLVARDTALQPGKLACKEPMWWDGIELVPPRPKLGLLGKIWGGSGLRQPCQVPDSMKSSRKMRRQASQVTDASSPSSSVACSDEDNGQTGCCDSSGEEDSFNSEESNAWPPLKQVSKFKRKSRYYTAKRSDGGRSWSDNLTVRYNQDNQRDFEERAAMQMVALLTKRTSADCNLLQRPHAHSKQGHSWNHAQPLGGTYVRLEAEFREQQAQLYKCKNSSQSKGSARVKSSKIL